MNHLISENIKSTLDTYGVAIIPSVLDDDECSQMLSEMWDFFELITNNLLKRTDESTWREFYKLYPLHSMLVQHYSIGHAQFAWNLRQNPKFVSIFAKLYDCSESDLLVSFDGSSFHLPPEVTNKGWFNNKWLHTDQSFLTSETISCIQSWVTALDVNEDDATLVVLEKSHLLHKQFGEVHNKTDKEDWYKLTTEEYQWYVDQGCVERRISCPKGSLVLWNSKTIHCGVEPLRTRKNPNIRAVCYLCYQPKNLLSSKELEKCIKKKQKAFYEKRTTSHWPLRTKLFPKNPRTYGGELPDVKEIPLPVLSDLGKNLAGLD